MTGAGEATLPRPLYPGHAHPLCLPLRRARRPIEHPSLLLPSPAFASPVAAARALVAVLLLALAVAAWVRIGGDWRRARPVRQHLNAGIESANQGLGPQAEAEWKEALRLDPRSADACRLLSEYYLSARDWPRALVALQRLQALSPKEEHLDCRLA